MTMVDRSMRGLYPILAMPFDVEGKIDLEDLESEVEFAIDSGVDGLGIALGSEIFKLSESERDLVISTVVNQSRERVKIVVNTGAQGTDLTITYSQRAQELGANAVMIAPPTQVPLDSAIIREYYRMISDAIAVPIFIQDFSSMPVSPELAVQISLESENACYAKVETPPTPPRVAEAVKNAGDSLIVFGGIGGKWLIEELHAGSVGTMPHCAVPDLMRKVIDMFQNGQEENAEKTFNSFKPLLSVFEKENGPSAYHLSKEVLRLRGVFKSSNVRHPAIRPDDTNFRQVQTLVESLDLSNAFS